MALAEQLLCSLRDRIVDGRFHAGARMPASRFMARMLGVSRNTVVDVYETLIAEGLIAARQGRGTFVLDNRVSQAPRSVTGPIVLSDRSSDLLSINTDCSLSNKNRVLEPGVPALDRFPHDRWRRSFAAAMKRSGADALMSDDAQGSYSLRSLIAAHIGPSRNVACNAEQVVLFSSQRLALHVLMMLLLDPGDPVLIENPCLPEFRAVARVQNLRPVPIPVGETGADIGYLSQEMRAAKLAIVTPSHQYPTGVAMAPMQRKALLDWAAAEGAYIIEDDYDGEFWLSDNRVSALFTEATQNQVIYFNTFSKTLFPALRIGYLVLPEALVEPVTALKSLLEPQVSTMAELALTEFIRSGSYTAHLRDMRQVYSERYSVLRFALEQSLGGRIGIPSRSYGLHLCVDLDPQIPDQIIAAAMKADGFGCKALSGYCFAPDSHDRNGLVMGYAGWNAPDLTRAVAALTAHCS